MDGDEGGSALKGVGQPGPQLTALRVGHQGTLSPMLNHPEHMKKILLFVTISKG